MFGFIKNRQLLEQKKMIWQNYFGSKDMIEVLEGRDFNHDLNERLISKLESINSMAGGILNNGSYKSPLSKERLNYVWQDNKALRGIYDTHIRTGRGQLFDESFDQWINPPYGWDVALKDWD